MSKKEQVFFDGPAPEQVQRRTIIHPGTQYRSKELPHREQPPEPKKKHSLWNPFVKIPPFGYFRELLATVKNIETRIETLERQRKGK